MGSETPSNSTTTEDYPSTNGNVDENIGMLCGISVNINECDLYFE